MDKTWVGKSYGLILHKLQTLLSPEFCAKNTAFPKIQGSDMLTEGREHIFIGLRKSIGGGHRDIFSAGSVFFFRGGIVPSQSGMPSLEDCLQSAAPHLLGLVHNDQRVQNSFRGRKHSHRGRRDDFRRRRDAFRGRHYALNWGSRMRAAAYFQGVTSCFRRASR